jgi:predicted DNA-binding transcriptional regulator YafY
MGQLKNSLIRYRIIDKALRNNFKPFPSKEEIRKACEEALFGSDDGNGICDSTIEKDMFFLRMEHDAPIKYSKKHRGYYYDSDSFSLDDLPLTDEDLDAIRFAANTLSQFKDVEMFNQFGFAIEKIVDRVSVNENISRVKEESLVHFEHTNTMKGSEFLTILLQAIRSNKYVFFDYCSFKSDKVKPRKVIPFLLKEYRNRWYLISFDIVKEAITTYALERMENVVISDDKVIEDVSFDVYQFFENSIGITVYDSPIEKILFKANNIASKYVESQPFHKSQKTIKVGKNRTTFELNVIVTEELIRQFLSYAGEIEILEPLSLRTILKERVIEMTKIYL